MIGRRRAPAGPEPARRARFEALFGAVYEPLQHYLGRRTDAATADDVLAETLLVLWRRIDEVPPEAVVPWAIGVARRCLANARRGGDRQDRLVQRLAREPDPAPPDDDPELWAALQHLGVDDREIVRLWAWERYTPAEIAVVMGLSANAVSIRLHRAKKALAAQLDPRRKDAGGDGHLQGDDDEASERSER